MELQPPITPDNDVLRCLSNPRHRAILKLLLDRASPVGVRELATNLAAEEGDKPLVDVTREEERAVRADLLHRHLPQLEAANLVAWSEAEGTVSPTDHPALSDPNLRQIVDVATAECDAVLANLASERRRTILTILKDHDGDLARAELAKAIVARERDAHEPVQPTDEAANVLPSLHHTHLPKLRAAGLVSYDPTKGTVSYEGHPALADEWLDALEGETPRDVVPTPHRSGDIWTIEGRDDVIARGQSLFEQADNELFLLFTTDGLLEDGCIRRLQDAVDRGVDVYLGSQTPAVRGRVRERVHGAVIWEPQLDWLNLPPSYERVGRLVFADREAVMLATLGERIAGDVTRETAITGSGQDNPLVVLLRELLGSRLDHLDAQSEDFRSELPL